MASTTQRTNQPASSPAKVTHPLYADFITRWTKLAHVREGIGGFLDGTYLIAHPREWKDHKAANPSIPTPKLIARRNLACYENIAGMLLEAKKAALFREGVTRRCGKTEKKEGQKPTPIETWWNNVDGKGTHIDDYMKQAWDRAATFGHIAIYMDRPKGPRPTTRADQKAPFIRMYAPLDIVDWSEDDNGELMEMVFAEAVPRRVGGPVLPTDIRYRFVDRDKWELRDKNDAVIEAGAHQFGCLPIAMLYSLRRPLLPVVGESVLGDPQQYIDLYNLLSELRELLRSQTFSIMNIPLGTGDQAMSVEDAAKLIGEKVGTDNVLFSGLAADFIAADAANVEVYQKEIDRRLRTIFRIAALAWESDSRDAEAEGSRQIKREDMNQRLSSYADELEKADYKLVEFFTRAMHGADAWERELETNPVAVHYPDNFDPTPFDEVLKQAQAAMNIGMPTEFLKELRKQLVQKFLPDLPPDVLKKINDAIANAPDDLTPQQRTEERVKGAVSGFKKVAAA